MTTRNHHYGIPYPVLRMSYMLDAALDRWFDVLLYDVLHNILGQGCEVRGCPVGGNKVPIILLSKANQR
jgi:hypothetical protein